MPKTFDDLLEDARINDMILGVVLVGSRGKNMVTEHSDDDVNLIVERGMKDQVEHLFTGLERVDLVVYELQEFEEYAAWGSDEAWDRYDFAHAQVLVDKTGGKIESIVREKGTLPKSAQDEVVVYGINACLNGIFRALKNVRDERMFAARLGAAETIPWYFVTVIFGLEGRVKPYDKYLLWEVNNHPLKSLTWSSEELEINITTLLDFSSPKVLRSFLDELIKATEKTQYKKVLEDWSKEIDWMKKQV